MPIKTISSRAFNQDVGGAKRATLDGPVVITDRGRPAHVLMTIEEYQRLQGSEASIVDLLAMPDAADVAFDAPRVQGLTRPVDLS